MERRRFRCGHPVDLRLTLGPLRHGPRDPCVLFARDGFWRATRTPEGPGTQRISLDGDRINVAAWGPGAGFLVGSAPALLGAEDDPAAFRPRAGPVRELARRFSGLRVGRSAAVVEALVPAVVEQKVISAAAHDSYRRLVRALGDPAPGPTTLYLPPPPELLARLPYHSMHRFGIERRRARVISNACSYAPRLEETSGMAPDSAAARLCGLVGVGPWTAAVVAGVALGDPDAVIVGDFNLPHLTSWVLAGEPRGSNERMLELLEPYRGQRGRVLRLIKASGLRPPRRGPRLGIRSIASI